MLWFCFISLCNVIDKKFIWCQLIVYVVVEVLGFFFNMIQYNGYDIKLFYVRKKDDEFLVWNIKIF